MDEKLKWYKNQIDETLANIIPIHSPFFPSLYEGGRYTLLAPGKRIRPLLTLSTAEMLKEGSIDAALLPACAIEMVHTYSLIHDDLPCMDDDDFRRGLPTLHRVYTEGHAVLIGDYLLTHAFAVLAAAPHLTAEQKMALIHTLTTAAGGEGMIGGQIMDIECSSHVENMHAYKTGALFCAALEFGGIIAQTTPAIMQVLHLFGMEFGKLFQMVDDMLDNDHPLGPEKAEEAVKLHFESAMNTLDHLPMNSLALKNLTELVFSVV